MKRTRAWIPLGAMALLFVFAAMFPELKVALSRDSLFVGWRIFMTGAWLSKQLEDTR